MPLQLVATVVLLFVSFSILRLYFILRRRLPRNAQQQLKPRTRPAHLLVVLGSGGHTAEMMIMLQGLDAAKFTRRTYIVSSGDNFSADRAEEFEKNHLASDEGSGIYSIVTVYRARKIHQSIITAPFSSLICLINCLQVLRFGASSSTFNSVAGTSPARKEQAPNTPDVIITNGPATGVIAVLAALIVRFCSFSDLLASLSLMPDYKQQRQGSMRTVYVESWARVKRLSLSGKLLLRMVDRFMVQWESLLPATNGRGEYMGALMELPEPAAV